MSNKHSGIKGVRYAKISLKVLNRIIKRRQQLVELVFEKSLSISKASKRLRIKNSTARLIIKRFEEDGTYF